MPRSFSRSMESSTWPTAFFASMVPVSERSRSARVDLPWSMCATMEKLRIRAVLIVCTISRPVLARVRQKALVRGDDAIRFEHDARLDSGACSDLGSRADDAIAHDGAVADRYVIPEDCAGDVSVAADHAVLAQHGLRADTAPGANAAAGPDDTGAANLGCRVDGDVVGDPPPIGARDHAQRRGHLAVHEVQLGLPVLGGIPDVEP